MDRTKTQRNLTWRGRKAAGVIVCPVELNSAALTEALRRKGVIAPDYTPGQASQFTWAALSLLIRTVAACFGDPSKEFMRALPCVNERPL